MFGPLGELFKSAYRPMTNNISFKDTLEEIESLFLEYPEHIEGLKTSISKDTMSYELQLDLSIDMKIPDAREDQLERLGEALSYRDATIDTNAGGLHFNFQSQIYDGTKTNSINKELRQLLHDFRESRQEIIEALDDIAKTPGTVGKAVVEPEDKALIKESQTEPLANREGIAANEGELPTQATPPEGTAVAAIKNNKQNKASPGL